MSKHDARLLTAVSDALRAAAIEGASAVLFVAADTANGYAYDPTAGRVYLANGEERWHDFGGSAVASLLADDYSPEAEQGTGLGVALEQGSVIVDDNPVNVLAAMEVLRGVLLRMGDDLKPPRSWREGT